MSDVSAVTRYWPTVNEGFTTTLGAGGVLSGGAVIPLNSISGLTNGSVFVGIIEPGQSKQQVFTGTVDTAGAQLTGVKWTRGANTDHLAGVTIVDYVSGTGINMISAGIKKFANDDGSLKTAAVQTALNLDASTLNGWNALGGTFNSVTYNGNHSYTCVINGLNVTGVVSPGMRVRSTRNTVSPTQSTSLNGTTQSWSRTSTINGMTFTDDFVTSAWVKVSGYNPNAAILSRFNGTSGWELYLNASGQITLQGFNGGPGNTSYIVSLQSVPLNRWVHIAAQLDMSSFTTTPTTSYAMLDGVDIPISVARAGTNPSALVQAGNLEVGSMNGGLQPFPGKLAQVALFGTKITQATMQGYISQGLTGSESGLVSAYSLSGSANDLNTTNNNHLTSNGGATYVTDAPFGTQADGSISSTLNYGIVQSASFSTNTTLVVQVPEGCTIATTGGTASVAYSSNKAPYGMPIEGGRWRVFSYTTVQETVGIGSLNNWFASAGGKIAIPIGSWRYGFQGTLSQESTVAGQRSAFFTLASSTPPAMSAGAVSPALNLLERAYTGSTAGGVVETPANKSDNLTLSAMTIYGLYGAIDTNSGIEVWKIRAEQGPVTVFADNAYL